MPLPIQAMVRERLEIRLGELRDGWNIARLSCGFPRHWERPKGDDVGATAIKPYSHNDNHRDVYQNESGPDANFAEPRASGHY